MSHGQAATNNPDSTVDLAVSDPPGPGDRVRRGSLTTGAPRSAELIAPFEAAAADMAIVVGALEVARLDGDGVAGAFEVIRSPQCMLDAAIVRVGMQADRLAEDGGAASARDACLAAGTVRGSTARREAKRAALAARHPDLGRAMTSGRLGPDHLDALVRRLGQLSDSDFVILPVADLLADGFVLPADTFDAALHRAVESGLPAPEGESDGGPAMSPRPTRRANRPERQASSALV